jgi:hypothetical protein
MVGFGRSVGRLRSRLDHRYGHMPEQHAARHRTLECEVVPKQYDFNFFIPIGVMWNLLSACDFKYVVAVSTPRVCAQHAHHEV